MSHTAAFASLVLALAATLAGCAPERGETPDAAQVDAWAEGPRIQSVQPDAGGWVIIGRAPPGDRVRAASSTGQTYGVNAAGDGRFHLAVPSGLALFELSSGAGEGASPVDGWLLLGANGAAPAIVQAGAGARVLAEGRGLKAVDFDSSGGVSLSGRAAPGARVDIEVDGRIGAAGIADGEGRFDIKLPRPLSQQSHTFRARWEGGADRAHTVTLGSPRPEGLVSQAPHEGEGVRIDWATPGGGAQATVILVERAAP